MVSRNVKTKNRGLKNGHFAGIPDEVMHTQKYRCLTAWAIRLLLEFARQYRGNNNGDLCAAWSLMRERGFRSKGTLQRALEELLKADMIEETRKGGRHKAALYALTWAAIDDCRDKKTKMRKLDVRPTDRASGKWHDEN